MTRSNKAVTKFEPTQEVNASSFTLYRVQVSDAGDPVAGATVSAGGKSAKTGAGAAVTLSASVSGTQTITVAVSGYNTSTVKISV